MTNTLTCCMCGKKLDSEPINPEEIICLECREKDRPVLRELTEVERAMLESIGEKRH